MGIKVIGLHHTNVHLETPEQSRDFYGRILGMEADSKPEFSTERPNFWWQVGRSGAQIHTPSHGGGGGSHFALMVEDIDETKRTLDAEGIAYREQKAAGRALQIFIQDPAGNQIELFQPPVWDES
ncbi:MAG TPA: glyoxalase superfamily protein [Chloroflexota bacterium]|nr:glyoxalase superfamily protein [Chloroflexota bacterium]